MNGLGVRDAPSTFRRVPLPPLLIAALIFFRGPWGQSPFHPSPMLGRFQVTPRLGSLKSRVSAHKNIVARKMSSQLKYREPIVLNAKGILLGTVIFMHGLGDSGEGWADGMRAIQQQLPNVKFILPHAYVKHWKRRTFAAEQKLTFLNSDPSVPSPATAV